MNGTVDDDSIGLRVYVAAASCRELLERLKAASVKCDLEPPLDLPASEDALRAVTEFLETIPAIRETGVSRPLRGLLEALPHLLRLAVRFNQCLDDLSNANTDRGATELEAGATQLSVLLRFVEDATQGQIGATLQPARELFANAHDRAQGGRPSPWFNAPLKRSRNRAHDITRAYLAAAVDVLAAANMSERAARKWWGRAEEYKRAHKWREDISRGAASPLTILVFRDLRPDRRPVTEADAKTKALEWRQKAEQRRTDA